jgi:hypothetical protein
VSSNNKKTMLLNDIYSSIIATEEDEGRSRFIFDDVFAARLLCGGGRSPLSVTFDSRHTKTRTRMSVCGHNDSQGFMTSSIDSYIANAVEKSGVIKKSIIAYQVSTKNGG